MSFIFSAGYFFGFVAELIRVQKKPRKPLRIYGDKTKLMT